MPKPGTHEALVREGKEHENRIDRLERRRVEQIADARTTCTTQGVTAMASKFDVIDDNGNIINPPDMTSDVGQIIYLLEYCRKREFMIGPTVQVGDVIVQVRDLRQVAKMRQDTGKAPEDGDVWTRHGFDPNAGAE
jgi:hypothetical protein